MTLEEYNNQLEHLQSFCDNNFASSLQEELSAQYAFVSANLSNFLPGIKTSEHPSIYHQILFHQKLSILDEAFPRAMNDLKVKYAPGINIDVFQTKPAIFCTMHMGSYRLINFFLKQQHIPFALVANKNIVETEREKFERHYNNFPVDGAFPLSIIDAEHPASAITMFRALKQGKSLLIYIDGNTGSGNLSSDNDNLCCIDFLSQKIYARSGAAYLALKAQVPIIPVIAFKPSIFSNTLQFLKPIYPFLRKDEMKCSLLKTIQAVYKQMEEIIKMYPGQWEGWLYVHKSVKNIQPYKLPEKVAVQKDYIHFNADKYAMFKIDNRTFLLCKNSYHSHLINKKIYNFLLESLPTHMDNITLNNSLLNTLLSEKIILKS